MKQILVYVVPAEQTIINSAVSNYWILVYILNNGLHAGSAPSKKKFQL